jgi:hypothetical protein
MHFAERQGRARVLPLGEGAREQTRGAPAKT